MSFRKLFTVVIVLEIVGIAVVANAQVVLPGGKTIGQSLDDVGKSILGVFSNDKDSQENKETNEKGVNNKQAYRPVPGKSESARPTGDVSTSRGITVIRPSNTTDNRPGRRFFEQANIQDGAETPENTPILSTPPSRKPLVVNPSNNSNPSSELSEQKVSVSPPLYERLSQFRRSAFDDPSRGASIDESTKSDATTARSELSRPSASSTAVTIPAGRPTPAKRPAGAASTDRLSVAERTSPTTRLDGALASEVPSISKPITVKDSGKLSVNLETPPAKENGILFARTGPILSVETHGPRKITVGKESSYEVKIINSGDVAAEDLVVFVNLPDWAEVIGAEAGVGTTQAGQPTQPSSPFQWKAGHLEAKSQEKLILRIVPRQSRPFDLAVFWEFKPAVSQNLIEVQEPKLEMQLDGPREVFYGKKETFRLKILNSGTGNAEDVAIKFVPIGAGENVQATYNLGLLPAGEDKVIEVELIARQSGMLEIQVEAKGDAGIHAELAEKVLVRRAGLEIAVEGPKLQFVGATATYTVRVRNPGNAPAKNINFTIALPPGLKYLGGIENARTDSAGNKLQWTAESVNPQAVQTFAVKCVPGVPGVSRVEVDAKAEDDLSASAVAVTQVESVANLALDVKDPGEPVPVGDEATYEIHVSNRGTKDAEGVELIGYFSRGIEPTAAEGGANRVGPGQVVFLPIPTLAPGAEKVLKITARAEAPGNHIFRAEMHCKTLGSRLVSEKTTLYYQDALAIPQNMQARPTADRSTR